MTDTEIRSILKNDTVMARRIDGDDDFSSDNSHSPRSSMLSTDSETLVPSLSSKSPRTGASGAFNTGPKGVREDARAFREEQARFAGEKRLGQQTHISNIGQAKTWSQDQADIDARERWVEKRMKELSKKRGHNNHSSATGAGKLEAVDATGYLETVESNPFVVVLIYDDDEHGDDSKEIIDLLSLFPTRYPHYKFILLHRDEAEMDNVAIPALLYYQNSNLMTSIMRIQDEIPTSEQLDAKSLEKVLIQHGVVSG